MSGRRRGWDFAQLRSRFAGDPEFVQAARLAPDDLAYLAAVGLWALAMGRAWAEDDPDVRDVLDRFDVPAIAALLERVGLVRDGQLSGFAKWTDAVRRERESDADRKRAVRRTPPDSAGQDRSPAESPRGVVVVEGNRSQVPTANPARARAGQRRSGGPSKVELSVVRLTRVEAEAWSDFTGPEWREFRAAWHERGHRLPPWGEKDGDDKSQRAVVFEIARDRPKDLAGWIREAPGSTPRQHIGYALERWREIKRGVAAGASA